MPSSVPALLLTCRRCSQICPFASTEKFRVNANGPRLDVWLIYHCVACGQTRNATVYERVNRREVADLDAFHHSDEDTARQWAFALAAQRPAVPVTDFVLRTDFVGDASTIRFAVPHPVKARLDRVLAVGLGCSRAAVKGRVADRRALSRPVYDSQEVSLVG